jgi:hypothetical protein
MTEKTDQPDKRDEPQTEEDVEGHSMLMYEQARVVTRERERDIQKHAKDARMLEEQKHQKR